MLLLLLLCRGCPRLLLQRHELHGGSRVASWHARQWHGQHRQRHSQAAAATPAARQGCISQLSHRICCLRGIRRGWLQLRLWLLHSPLGADDLGGLHIGRGCGREGGAAWAARCVSDVPLNTSKQHSTLQQHGNALREAAAQAQGVEVCTRSGK